MQELIDKIEIEIKLAEVIRYKNYFPEDKQTPERIANYNKATQTKRTLEWVLRQINATS